MTTADGAAFTGTISRPVGHAPGVPLPAQLLKTKFEHCASRVMPLAQAERVNAMVQDFDHLASISQLMSALAVPKTAARRKLAPVR